MHAHSNELQCMCPISMSILMYRNIPLHYVQVSTRTCVHINLTAASINTISCMSRVELKLNG